MASSSSKKTIFVVIAAKLAIASLAGISVSSAMLC